MSNNSVSPEDKNEHINTGVHVIGLCIMVALLAILIIAGNLLVIIAVALNRRLQNVTSAFITSLAFGDLLIGILVLPLIVISNILGPRKRDGLQYCHVTVSFAVMLMFNSVANLGAVSLDRYLAIVVPLRYKAIMTRRLVTAIIASLWVFSTIFGFVPFMGWREVTTPKKKGLYCQVPFNLDRDYIITTCVVALCPTFFMLTAYYRIFKTAHDHSTRIACAISRVIRQQAPSKFCLLKETKAAKMVAIVLGSFLFCWCPLFVIMIVDVATDNSVDSYIYAGGVIFATINSALNPVIYAAMNKEFRSTFKRLLQCKTPSHGAAPDQPARS